MRINCEPADIPAPSSMHPSMGSDDTGPTTNSECRSVVFLNITRCIYMLWKDRSRAHGVVGYHIRLASSAPAGGAGFNSQCVQFFLIFLAGFAEYSCTILASLVVTRTSTLLTPVLASSFIHHAVVISMYVSAGSISVCRLGPHEVHLRPPDMLIAEMIVPLRQCPMLTCGWASSFERRSHAKALAVNGTINARIVDLVI